jgi:hypothetical protein
MEALASVDSESGEKRRSPEDGRPSPNRGGEEPSHDDSEEETCVGAKKETGAASKSEHEKQGKRGEAEEGRVTDRSVSHLGHIVRAIPRAMRATFSLSSPKVAGSTPVGGIPWCS